MARSRKCRATMSLLMAVVTGIAGCGASNGGSTQTTTVIKKVTVRRATKAPFAKQRVSHVGEPRVPAIREMVGQMLVSYISGTTAPPALLQRIRTGELGGVILYSENTAGGPATTRDLISALQAAAVEGGEPPLLITTDQEGGEVRRLQWAPPAYAPAEMPSAAVARREGEGAGRALRAVGVNLDLAPVSDVELAPHSFLGARSFGSNPTVVAERACAFAAGLEAEGVGFTLKHFPGLGRATGDTDNEPVTISASASELRADYGAYETCAGDPDAVVMVSNAAYPALTGNDTPAVLSPEIYSNELGNVVGFHGVTISDDLQAGALTNQASPGQRAIEAGLDLLLYASTEEASATAYQRLVSLVESGVIKRSRVEDAYHAILGLKRRIAGASAVQGNGNRAEDYPGSVSGSETLTVGGSAKKSG